MTQKEAVLAMLRGEKVDTIVNGWEPFQIVFDDLLMHTSPARPGVKIVDAWGGSGASGLPGRDGVEEVSDAAGCAEHGA